jgi:hypothetical protein
MKHRILTSAVAVSSALLLFILALGARSYRVGDIVSVTDNTLTQSQVTSRQVGLATSRGRLLVSITHSVFSMSDPRDKASFPKKFPAGIHWARNTQLPEDMIDMGWNDTFWRGLGFVAVRYPSRLAGASRTRIGAPFWCVAFPFALPMTFSLMRRLRRSRRLVGGLCPTCGYDLRATPSRCPECGWFLRPHSVTPLRRVLPWIGISAMLLAATVLALTGPPARLLPSAADNPSSIRAQRAANLARTTQPATALTTPSLPNLPEWKGLPTYHPNHPIPPQVREIAARVDPSQTYVFLYISPSARPSLAKKNMASVQVFARRAHRWRCTILYLKAGQAVGSNDYPTSLKIGEIRPIDDDLLVTFVDSDGKTFTRSGNADLQDPVQEFLMGMVGNMGTAWEDVLFPP